jgi:DNA-directed RNA polymerase specialized sigma24 family protein
MESISKDLSHKTSFVLGFSKYVAHSDGRIFSLRLNRFLKPYKSKRGYLRITLVSDSGTHFRTFVHRIIVTAFIGQIPTDKVINHIDSDKENNDISNLEIVTQSYNVRHGYLSGQRAIDQSHRERCASLGRSLRKLSDKQEEEAVARVLGGESRKSVMRSFGCHQDTYINVKRRYDERRSKSIFSEKNS